MSSKKNIKYDSNYLAAIKILENFEKENINIFSKTVKKYIQSRKTNCFHQFILRSLCYDNKKIIKYNKNLINKSGKINLQNNFYNNKKQINYLLEIKRIKKLIIDFLKNNKNNKNNKIALYGYGAIGKSIKKFLNTNKYKNLIIFDDKASNVKINNSVNNFKLIEKKIIVNKQIFNLCS